MAAITATSVFETRGASSTGEPINLVHLGHQTQGDQQLEKEILSMFAMHSQTYFNMMTKCCDATTRIRAAHSLKGVSRSIGAFQLADLAEQAEVVRHEGYEAIEKELDRVLEYIQSLK